MTAAWSAAKNPYPGQQSKKVLERERQQLLIINTRGATNLLVINTREAAALNYKHERGSNS